MVGSGPLNSENVVGLLDELGRMDGMSRVLTDGPMPRPEQVTQW